MSWITDPCAACGRPKLRTVVRVPVHRDCFDGWSERDAWARDAFENFPERSEPFMGFLLHRDAPIAVAVFAGTDDARGVTLTVRHLQAMEPVHVAAHDWPLWLAAAKRMMHGHHADLALVRAERPRLAAAFPTTESIIETPLVQELLANQANARATREAEERAQDLTHQHLHARAILSMIRERPRPCPHCAEVRDDVRFVDGGTERPSFFICQGCGRSSETL